MGNPVDPSLMQAIAEALEDVFNGEDCPIKDRKIGYVLMAFPFNESGGRAEYVTNADRQDLAALLREMAAYLQGAPDGQVGHS